MTKKRTQSSYRCAMQKLIHKCKFYFECLLHEVWIACTQCIFTTHNGNKNFTAQCGFTRKYRQHWGKATVADAGAKTCFPNHAESRDCQQKALSFSGLGLNWLESQTSTWPGMRCLWRAGGRAGPAAGGDGLTVKKTAALSRPCLPVLRSFPEIPPAWTRPLPLCIRKASLPVEFFPEDCLCKYRCGCVLQEAQDLRRKMIHDARM